MESRFSGESNLSGLDVKLWKIVQHVLMTWSTLVIFKYWSRDVRTGERGLIEFFVPGDATHRYEIEEFLKTELADEASEDYAASKNIPEHPGTEVKIHLIIESFRGLEPYIAEAESRKWATEYTKQLMQVLTGEKKAHDRTDWKTLTKRLLSAMHTDRLFKAADGFVFIIQTESLTTGSPAERVPGGLNAALDVIDRYRKSKGLSTLLEHFDTNLKWESYGIDPGMFDK